MMTSLSRSQSPPASRRWPGLPHCHAGPDGARRPPAEGADPHATRGTTDWLVAHGTVGLCALQLGVIEMPGVSAAAPHRVRQATA